MFKVLFLFFSVQLLCASQPQLGQEGVTVHMSTVVNGHLLCKNLEPLMVAIVPREPDTMAPIPRIAVAEILSVMQGVTQRRLGCSVTSPELMLLTRSYVATEILTSDVNGLQFRFCCTVESALPQVAELTWRKLNQ